MRELKFRVWDEKYHRWEHGRMAYVENIVSQGRIYQQYTGLKDDSDKEIYEGDIMYVSYSQGHPRDSSYDWHGNYEVVFKNGEWRLVNGEDERSLYQPDYEQKHIKDFDVMGNIFENKELLE